MLFIFTTINIISNNAVANEIFNKLPICMQKQKLSRVSYKTKQQSNNKKR